MVDHKPLFAEEYHPYWHKDSEGAYYWRIASQRKRRPMLGLMMDHDTVVRVVLCSRYSDPPEGTPLLDWLLERTFVGPELAVKTHEEYATRLRDALPNLVKVLSEQTGVYTELSEATRWDFDLLNPPEH